MRIFGTLGAAVSFLLLATLPFGGCQNNKSPSTPSGPEIVVPEIDVEADLAIMREYFHAFADEINHKSLEFSHWDKSSPGYHRELQELKQDFAEDKRILIRLFDEIYSEVTETTGSLEIHTEFNVKEIGKKTWDPPTTGGWRLKYRREADDWLIIDSSFFPD